MNEPLMNIMIPKQPTEAQMMVANSLVRLADTVRSIRDDRTVVPVADGVLIFQSMVDVVSQGRLQINHEMTFHIEALLNQLAVAAKNK
jgi:hypothetical protein